LYPLIVLAMNDDFEDDNEGEAYDMDLKSIDLQHIIEACQRKDIRSISDDQMVASAPCSH
jgi:hypothetical protein